MRINYTQLIDQLTLIDDIIYEIEEKIIAGSPAPHIAPIFPLALYDVIDYIETYSQHLIDNAWNI